MISYSSQRRWGGIRQSLIKTQFGSIKGPTVALTDNEYRNIMRLSKDDSPVPRRKHKIFEVRKDLTQDTLETFKERGWEWSDISNEVTRLLDENGDKVTFFRGRVKGLRTNEEGDRVDSEEITSEENELIIRFAVDQGFDWVAVHGPSLECSPKEFEDRLRESQDVAEQLPHEFDIIPVVNIKNDAATLLEKLEIVEDLGFEAVAVNMSAIGGNSDRLSTIKNFADSDKGQIMIYACHVPRFRSIELKEGEGNVVEKDASVRQLLPLFGVDVIGYDNRTYGRGPEQGAEDDTKWLIENLGEYRRFRHLEDNTEDALHCHAPCCDGKHASQVYDGSDNHGNIYSRIWLHDVFSLYRSFEVLREILGQGEGEKYYQERPILLETHRQWR